VRKACFVGFNFCGLRKQYTVLCKAVRLRSSSLLFHLLVAQPVMTILAKLALKLFLGIITLTNAPLPDRLRSVVDVNGMI
jgi:hypothetical protein